MSELPPPLDVVTIAHPNERIALAGFRTFYKNGSYWGYSPANYAFVDIVNKATSVEMAKSSCLLRGSKEGRKHNVDVAVVIYFQFLDTGARAARMFSRMYYNFRPDLRLFLPAAGLVQQASEQYIVVLLPRAEAPSIPQQALLHWLYRQGAAFSPYKDLPIKFLLADRVRRKSGPTELITQDHLPEMRDHEALERISGFLKAYDLAREEGLGGRGRREHRPDDGQGKLL